MKISYYVALSVFLIFSTVGSICFASAPAQEPTKLTNSASLKCEGLTCSKEQANVKKIETKVSTAKKSLKSVFYNYVLPLIKKIFGGVIDYTVASIIGNMIECRSSSDSGLDDKGFFDFLRSPCCQCNLNTEQYQNLT